MAWALIAGRKHSGKTTLARAIASALTSRGVRIAGVVQEPIEIDGERVAYDAVRLGTAPERITVARRGTPDDGDAAVCSFSFDEAAFAHVARWVEADAPGADIIFFDEVSKAEVRGLGHAAAITRALRGDALVLLSVRADELVHVVAQFALGDAVAAIETGSSLEEISAFVERLAARRRT
jgi:nucleoside-triphosphatase THEP1